MTESATTTIRRHPTPKQYWQLAAALGLITAIEVGASYVEGLRGVIVAVLIVSAVVKFVVVAGWFMHLRFDRPVYTRFFAMGIVGALLLFTVVLLTLGLLIGE